MNLLERELYLFLYFMLTVLKIRDIIGPPFLNEPKLLSAFRLKLLL